MKEFPDLLLHRFALDRAVEDHLVRKMLALRQMSILHILSIRTLVMITDSICEQFVG